MPVAVKPPFSVRQVLVCTNVRDPASGKPSCGRNGGIELREKLKVAVKKLGVKGQVIVTASGCVDFCPASGCAVGMHPENEWSVQETDEAAGDSLLERILQGTTARP